jgi:hypothetical protein
MTRTLSQARDEFVVAMNRDTVGTDRPRLLAVLDALIAWSVARPTQVRFRPEDSTKGVLTFERVGTKLVLWTATPRRADTPRLELLPRGTKVLSEEQRAAVVTALNAHSREVLESDDALRIGFGALKNVAARAAVLAVMDELLAITAPADGAPADRPAPRARTRTATPPSSESAMERVS